VRKQDTIPVVNAVSMKAVYAIPLRKEMFAVSSIRSKKAKRERWNCELMVFSQISPVCAVNKTMRHSIYFDEAFVKRRDFPNRTTIKDKICTQSALSVVARGACFRLIK
jgi:hypothetical protein